MIKVVLPVDADNRRTHDPLDRRLAGYLEGDAQGDIALGKNADRPADGVDNQSTGRAFCAELFDHVLAGGTWANRDDRLARPHDVPRKLSEDGGARMLGPHRRVAVQHGPPPTDAGGTIGILQPPLSSQSPHRPRTGPASAGATRRLGARPWQPLYTSCRRRRAASLVYTKYMLRKSSRKIKLTHGLTRCMNVWKMLCVASACCLSIRGTATESSREVDNEFQKRVDAPYKRVTIMAAPCDDAAEWAL